MILLTSSHFREWAISRASYDVHYVAAHKGWGTQLLRDFLDLGLNPNELHHHIHPPLISAAQYGCASSVSLLLSHGANVGDALWYAASSGCSKTVSVLLDAGADPDKTYINLTPLEHTVRTMYGDNNTNVGELKMIRSILLEKTTYSPQLLERAVRIGDWDWVSEIIRVKKVTLFFELLGEAKYRPSMTQNLLEAGLCPNQAKFLPLHVHAQKLGFCEILRMYIKWGADLNILDENGCTALMIAAGAGREETEIECPAEALGNVEAVILLLEAGTNVDVRCKDNLSALDYARKMYDTNNFMRIYTDKRPIIFSDSERDDAMESYRKIIDMLTRQQL